MGRKRGFNEEKISKIVSVLMRYPDGIWIRALAAECELAPNTVRHYLQTILSPIIIDTSLGRSAKPHLRVVRLKPYVLEKFSEGRDLRQVMKMLDVMNKL